MQTEPSPSLSFQARRRGSRSRDGTTNQAAHARLPAAPNRSMTNAPGLFLWGLGRLSQETAHRPYPQVSDMATAPRGEGKSAGAGERPRSSGAGDDWWWWGAAELVVVARGCEQFDRRKRGFAVSDFSPLRFRGRGEDGGDGMD
uniref:Uncharacterized protein n=1 Tax=Arundo donax TaxID=35708 RepID=A0A0A8XQS8_ARUDO